MVTFLKVYRPKLTFQEYKDQNKKNLKVYGLK